MVGWRYGYYAGAGFSVLTAASLYACKITTQSYRVTILSHFDSTVYTPIRRTKKTLRYVLRHDVDLVGTGLLIAFAVPFLIGLNW